MLDVPTGSFSFTLRTRSGEFHCMDCAAFHRKMQFLGGVEVQDLHKCWLNLEKRKIKV